MTDNYRKNELNQVKLGSEYSIQIKVYSEGGNNTKTLNISDSEFLKIKTILLNENTNFVNANHDVQGVNHAESLEDILCLSVLIANKAIPEYSFMYKAVEYYNNLENGCNDCEFRNECLACIINE